MEYVMLLLFIISSIGYFRWMRGTFRLSFSSAVFFSTCAILLLMMLFGLLHIMEIGAWLIFTCGFIPIILDVFPIRKRRLQINYRHRLSRYIGKEYLFYSFILLAGFWGINSYSGDLGTGDIWTSWYDQFYYMVLNNSWADSGYKSTDSAYCMIGNGFAYLLATVLGKYGTHVYIYAHAVMIFQLTITVLAFINWKRFSLLEFISVVSILTIFKLTGGWGGWVTVLLLLFLLKYIYCTADRRSVFSNIAAFVMAILFMFVLLQYVGNLLQYPLDILLGAAIAGAFILLIYDDLFYHRYAQRLYWYILPLIVISFIKPTGLIFSCYLAFGIGVFIVLRALNCFFQWNEMCLNQSKLRICFNITVVIITLLSPIIANKLWSSYCNANGLILKHKISTGEIASKAMMQLRNGISDDELARWQKKIKDINYYSRCNGIFLIKKTAPERMLDKKLASIISSCGVEFDAPLKDNNFYKNQSHILTISVILTLFSLMSAVLMKKKAVTILLMLIYSWIIIVITEFIQCYLVPMFTSMPGIFRYIFPGLMPLWATALCSMLFLLKKRCVWGYAVLIAFVYCCGTLFFAPSVNEFSQKSKNSFPRLGHVLLADKNSDGGICIAECSQDWPMYVFLIKRGFVPFREKYYKTFEIPQESSLGRSLLLTGNFAANNTSSEVRNLPQGLYNIDYHNNKTVFTAVLFDSDAIRLLNKVYSFDDPTCWKRPPVVEMPINGNFSHEKSLKDSKWNLVCDKKYNAPEHYQLKWRGWNKYALKLKTDKSSRLENWYNQYVFVEDKLNFSCDIDARIQATVFINLRKKVGKSFKTVKNIPMKTKIIEFGSKKYRLEGELDLSEHKGLDFDYYTFSIIFPAYQDGFSISEIKMMQTVSGKLYFPPENVIEKK